MNYKLSKPVVFGSETIESVEIKEDYEAGDIVRIQNARSKGEGGMMLEMLCVGTNLPAPKATKIPAKDAVKIVAKVNDFLGIGEM